MLFIFVIKAIVGLVHNICVPNPNAMHVALLQFAGFD
jgi:hypothetical protein